VAALSDWLDAGWWWNVFQVVLGLGAVIFVHELGHFLAAKACGVKAEKFYVGFDAFDIKIGDRVIIPRRLVHFQWGETEYGVGILPLGGYVKMLGQDDNPSKMAEERERAMTMPGEGVDGTALDPRSYMAKSVPQRMMIISAGVIMNLIFAVIFATLAFRFGVNYEPAEIGSTIPGSPAWQNNLDGATITEISGVRTDDPNRYFTFNHLRESIIMDSQDGPLEMEIVRPGPVTPSRESIAAADDLIGMKGSGGLKSLGIMPMLSSTLGDPPTLDGQAAEHARPPLMAGDRVVQIGETIIVNGFDMRSTFAQYSDQPVTIKVQRGGENGELIDVVLPPNRSRGLGIEMELGVVNAVRKGSPAEVAGIRPLDRLIAIDGGPVGDPFTLQQRMLRAARQRQTVPVTILRADSQSRREDGMAELKLEIRPELPRYAYNADAKFGITVESLGLNLAVKNRVAQSIAADAPLRPGDEIVSLKIELNPRQAAIERFAGLGEEIDVRAEPAMWPVIDSNIQLLDPGTRVIVKFNRDNLVNTADLTVTEQPDSFRETRGIVPVQLEKLYQNDNLWTAAKNGLRQTGDDATRVLKFLKKLVNGQLSVTHFGGPGTIAVVATAEASQGTSRLLLFLTLLSANLAIVNFLPIPVLDGGHMVFLAYEGIFRRPVSERLQLALTYAGLLFLVALMVTVIGLDIWRLT
jgi:regulator of sigma E protease